MKHKIKFEVGDIVFCPYYNIKGEITMYPSNWVMIMGESPMQKDGCYTDIAMEWSLQLTGLSPNEILKGIENLPNRSNNAFPPNAMEFKALCRSGDFESIMSEIISFIDRPKNSTMWWTSKQAYNVFIRLNYSPIDNETRKSLTIRSRNIYNTLKQAELKEIPEQVLAIEEEKQIKSSKEYRRKWIDKIKDGNI